jgi:cytoskeletal protein RodZ
MEEYTPEEKKEEEKIEEEQEEKYEDVKRWFQDNLRIIISIIIVILIAGGIYSYSKRGVSPIVTDNSASVEETTAKDESSTDISKNDTDKNVSEKSTTEKVAAAEKDTNKTAVSSNATSSETEASFIETAGKGDGSTVLARRALANYLEKNPDSALTKEHKIYIEDYLRKNIGQKGRVYVGTSLEFSKDLIQKAIAQSKNLNERQLQNLQKYSARVSSLS